MKKVLFTTLGWIISVALLLLLAAKLDLSAVWQKLAKTRWSMLALAASVNLVVCALKALRWQWFMKPTKHAGYPNVFKTTMIGFAGNNLLPARGGDVIKIYLLGKWEKTSKTALTSIAGLDKLFDGVAILIMLGLLSLVFTFPTWLRKGTITISAIIAGGLVISLLLLHHHRRTSHHSASQLGFLSRLAKKLGQGMGVFAHRNLLVASVIISVGIILLQVETIRLSQLAFGIHTAIWVPLLVFVAINLAIAVVPAAPSHIGPFEASAVLAYSFLGIKAETAMGIALAYHVAQLIPVTAIGLAFYLATGLKWRPTLWNKAQKA